MKFFFIKIIFIYLIILICFLSNIKYVVHTQPLTEQQLIYQCIENVNPSVMEINNNLNNSLGSGFYIGDNLVVTNKHVVNVIYPDGSEEISQEITIKNPFTRTQFKSKVIFCDQEIDVAILKIEDKDFNSSSIYSVKLGNSDDVRVGDLILCIGSPLGYTSSVTRGIISGLFRYHKDERDIDNQPNERYPYRGLFVRRVYLQIDATVNRGNSGGPLINMAGEVIGINTLTSYEYQIGANNSINVIKTGLNFAIPINVIKPVIQCIKRGEKPYPPYIGFDSERVTDDIDPQYIKSFNASPNAFQLEKIYSLGPLYEAGLRDGDIINKVNNQNILGFAHFMYILQSSSFEQSLNIEIIRPSTNTNEQRNFTVKVGNFIPDEEIEYIKTLNNFSNDISELNFIGTSSIKLDSIESNDKDKYFKAYLRKYNCNKIWYKKENEGIPRKLKCN